MTETTNYKLKKPAPNENYDVEDFNGNADIIDSKLKEHADGKAALESALAGHTQRITQNETDITDLETSKADKILTGYTKPSTGGALTPTDTVNEALGKLEANLDAAEAAIAGKADPSDLITVTLPVASWVKDSTREMWTQAVTHSSIVDDVRIGISVDDDTQLALMDAGVTLRIDNNNGTATAKAFGAIPESNITVQLTLTPVEVVA
ncbi:hypothetical protein [Anaerotruncus rubiinfantis]|uniref:hypothetical protein n=1 Tax=Anaerotruncus rubiinfantis TaxID=1720200 RepID=UPI00082AE571|nr:hypothetical protein [Anaerotruncus rubiinfantis]